MKYILMILVSLLFQMASAQVEVTYSAELRYSHCWWNEVCDTSKTFTSRDEIDEFANSILPQIIIIPQFLHTAFYPNREVKAYQNIRYFATTYTTVIDKMKFLGKKIEKTVTPLISKYGMTIGRIQMTNIGEFTYSTSRTRKGLPELTSVEGAEILRWALEVEILDTSGDLIAAARLEGDPVFTIEKLFNKYKTLVKIYSGGMTCRIISIDEAQYQSLLRNQRAKTNIIVANDPLI